MADRPILQVSGGLDEKQTKVQLQNQLDKIGKSLKLTIGFEQGGKNTPDGIAEGYKKSFRKIEDANAELYIKMFKAQEKAEERTRKSLATQEKASQQAKKDIQKEIELREKLILQFDKLQNKAKLYQYTVNQYSNKELRSGVGALNKEMGKLSMSQDMSTGNMKKMVNEADRLTSKMGDLTREATATGKSHLKMSEYLRNAFKAFSLWSVVTVGWYSVVNAIKSGIQAVRDLDTAMLELRKVTDLTNQELDKFIDRADTVGSSIGRTTIDVVKATSEFAKMGYSISESLRLGEDALILQNVGDGIDSVEQSTSVLVSTLKGFSLAASDSRKIIDSLNEVANNYAVGTDDLAEGIKRVASVSGAAGASFEQTLGLLTAMTEVSQNAEKSSNALKTLAMRIQGLDESGESLGGNFVAKLNDELERTAGVSITVDGKLKNLYDIVTELGGKWQSLTREQQMFIAQQLAGVRQSGEFINLMNNYKVAIGATEDALNSQGSALKENEKYMDSIAGKTEKFTSTVQNFWTSTINSDFIKFIIDIGIELVKFVDNVGVLTIALTALGVVMTKTNLLYGLQIASIGLYEVALGKMTLSTYAATVSSTGLATALNAIPYVAIASALIAITNGIFEANKATKEYNKTLEENKGKISEILYLGDQASVKDTIAQIEEAQKKIKQYTDTYGTIQFGWVNKKNKEAFDEGNNILAEFGLTASTASKRVEQLEKRLQELASAESKASNVTRTNSDVLSDLRANVQDVVDIQETYADLTQQIADGQKVSGIELLKLIQQYPQLSKHMDENNQLLLTKEMLEKTVWETEKQIALNRMESIREETKARQDSLSMLVRDYETVYSLGSQLSGQSAGIFMQKIAAAKKELEEANSSMLEIDASIKIIQGMKLSDYKPSESTKSSSSSYDKKDILLQFKAQQNAVSDLTYELGIMNEQLKHAEGDKRVELQNKILDNYKEQKVALHEYSNALRELRDKGKLTPEELEKVNEQLKDNSSSWWSVDSAMKDVVKTMKEMRISKLQEDLKDTEDSMSDYVDTLKEGLEKANDVLEDEIDALDEKQKLQEQINEDLDNQAKRQEILTKIQEKQLELSKAQAELENISNQKTVRMLNEEGTAFTLIADPKAIAEKKEEINGLTKDLTDLNKDLADHDLNVQRELAKREVEIEKAKLQEKIDKNKQYMQDIEDITKTSLDNQTALWMVFSSNVNAELQQVIGNIVNAISLQSSLNSKIAEESALKVEAPKTILGTGITTPKPTSMNPVSSKTPSISPAIKTASSSTINNNTPINIQTVNVRTGDPEGFISQLRNQVFTNK